jgi:hypothetical protein
MRAKSTTSTEALFLLLVIPQRNEPLLAEQDEEGGRLLRPQKIKRDLEEDPV